MSTPNTSKQELQCGSLPLSRTDVGIPGAGLLADHGDDASRLRRTVIAGPGGRVEVAETVLGGVWASMAEVITAGLTAAGHIDRRRRVLTGLVTVAAVLGLCLFRRESYDLVLARVVPASPKQLLDGGPPSGQALSTCRRELLDRTIIWNQQHLLHALREYERFYNGHRPHQGIANARPLYPLPAPVADPDKIARLDIRRRDRLGGVLHEYEHAA